MRLSGPYGNVVAIFTGIERSDWAVMLMLLEGSIADAGVVGGKSRTWNYRYRCTIRYSEVTNNERKRTSE